MAKLKDGILGAFLGKIGPVVASRRGSTIYIKSRPAKVRHPNTPRQKGNKNCFGVTSKLSSFLIDFHRHSLLVEPGRSSYNRFISLNNLKAVQIKENGPEIDYTKLILAVGDLEPLEDLKAERNDEGNLFFSWQYEAVAHANRNDQIHVLAIAPGLNDMVYRLNAAARIDGEAVLKIPEVFSSETVYVYACVQSIDQKESSDSQFVKTFN